MGSISALFHPDSVAVVGATPREGAVGRAVTANLLEDSTGDVVPVTPAHNEVLGVPAVDDVGETTRTSRSSRRRRRPSSTSSRSGTRPAWTRPTSRR